jgi:hypothetical protein
LISAAHSRRKKQNKILQLDVDASDTEKSSNYSVKLSKGGGGGGGAFVFLQGFKIVFVVYH